MKIKIIIKLIFLTWLIFFSRLSDAQKVKKLVNTLKEKELNVLPIPSITIGPEVGIMFGFFLDYYYKLGPKLDTTTRPSLSFVSFQQSTKKQTNVDIYSSTFTPGEKYYILLRAGYFDDFDQYWGTTKPSLPNEDFILTRFSKNTISGRTVKNLGNKHFLGLSFQYNKYFNVSFAETKFNEFIPPSPASNILGLGIVYNIDKRDNQFSPTKGYYVDILAQKMFDISGKTGGFMYYNLDLRKYFEKNRHVFANQIIIGSQQGDVPVFEKLRIGGPLIMRGMFRGRFRDDNLWAFQTEYRYRIIPQIKLAVFGSIGNTAPTFSSLLKQDLIMGYGTGIRIRINKSKKLYAKLDYALTNYNTSGFYLRLGDAF
jgi:outer membrane protein assembly factor BamA